MRRSTIIAGVLLFLGLFLALGGLAWFKMRQISAAASGGHPYEPAEAVELVNASEMQWQPTSKLVGTVVAVRSVTVRNEIAGPITHVGFTSGAIVEPGHTLLKQDDTTERADLEAAKASTRVAEANVAQSESQVRLAELELERLRSVTGRAVAEVERDRAASRLDSVLAERARWLAEVDQARARVAQVEARLAKLTIAAPFRARAGMRTVHEGQYLAEGTDVVMLQEITDEIYLDFAIPQEYAPRVSAGTAVMATGELLGPEPVRIEVVAADAAVNNGTRNLRVRAVVGNTDGRLIPGMFIQIEVPVESVRNYVAVPATAIRRAPYADSVFVAVPGEAPDKLRVRQQFVRLGPTVHDRVIVLEGVSPGDRVAAAGSFKLRDGALVSNVAPPSPPTALAPDIGAGALTRNN